MGKRSITSDEEDEEEAKRLRSCIVDTNDLGAFVPGKQEQEGLKLYQVRIQEQLEKYLDKNLEISSSDRVQPVPTAASEDDGLSAGFRLFRNAPSGIKLREQQAVPNAGSQSQQSQQHSKRRRLVAHNAKRWHSSGKDRFVSVAVDGEWVKAEAERTSGEACATWKANLIMKAELESREKSRVEALKRQRGEKWLKSLGGK